MFCKYCGRQIEPEALICPWCGQRGEPMRGSVGLQELLEGSGYSPEKEDGSARNNPVRDMGNENFTRRMPNPGHGYPEGGTPSGEEKSSDADEQTDKKETKERETRRKNREERQKREREKKEHARNQILAGTGLILILGLLIGMCALISGSMKKQNAALQEQIETLQSRVAELESEPQSESEASVQERLNELETRMSELEASYEEKMAALDTRMSEAESEDQALQDGETISETDGQTDSEPENLETGLSDAGNLFGETTWFSPDTQENY